MELAGSVEPRPAALPALKGAVLILLGPKASLHFAKPSGGGKTRSNPGGGLVAWRPIASIW